MVLPIYRDAENTMAVGTGCNFCRLIMNTNTRKSGVSRVIKKPDSSLFHSQRTIWSAMKKILGNSLVGLLPQCTFPFCLRETNAFRYQSSVMVYLALFFLPFESSSYIWWLLFTPVTLILIFVLYLCHGFKWYLNVWKCGSCSADVTKFAPGSGK